MRRAPAVLILPALLGCARDPEPERSWRLASLNAWGGPFSRELESRFARLPAAIRALAPDVACLQEVWLPPQRGRLREAFGGDFHVAASSGGGLLLASRFPIVEKTFVPFTAVEGPSFVERLARKGSLEAVLATPAGNVRVVTTHLAIEGPHRLQLEQLVRHLDARPDAPWVLASGVPRRPPRTRRAFPPGVRRGDAFVATTDAAEVVLVPAGEFVTRATTLEREATRLGDRLAGPRCRRDREDRASRAGVPVRPTSPRGGRGSRWPPACPSQGARRSQGPEDRPAGPGIDWFGCARAGPDASPSSPRSSPARRWPTS